MLTIKTLYINKLYNVIINNKSLTPQILFYMNTQVLANIEFTNRNKLIFNQFSIQLTGD